jgi:hypothetical protein
MARKVLTDLNATGRTITATTFSGDLSGTVGGITFSGTNATTMTLPSTTATLARTDDAQTFTGNQTFSGQVIANGNIGPTGTTALTVYTANQSSTTVSANIIMRSGNQTGTAVSGNVTVTTGTAAGANTGALTLGSGAATNGTSGNVSILSGTSSSAGNSGSVHINVGTIGTGSVGSINIGNAGVSNTVAPSAITIGASNVTTNLSGRVTTPFNTTTTTSGAGILSGVHYYYLCSNRSLTPSLGGSVFGVALPLETNTLYEYEISVAISTTKDSSSTAYNLSLFGNLPSGSLINPLYSTNATTTTGASSPFYGMNQNSYGITASNSYSSPFATTAGIYFSRGSFRTGGTSGSFTPFLQPSGSGALSALSVTAGSWVRVRKIGSTSANISIGAWA